MKQLNQFFGAFMWLDLSEMTGIQSYCKKKKNKKIKHTIEKKKDCKY